MEEAIREGVTRMGRDYCPSCNHPIDAASSLNDKEHIPVPGDISICFYCTELLLYEDDMSMSIVTSEKLSSLPSDHRALLLNAQKAIKEIKKKVKDE